MIPRSRRGLKTDAGKSSYLAHHGRVEFFALPTAWCPKRATPDQTGDTSWSFLFIIILDDWNPATLPRNITGNHLGITAADVETGFIRGEVRMYIALRDRPSSNDTGRKGSINSSQGCVKSLARKWTWREYHFLAPT